MGSGEAFAGFLVSNDGGAGFVEFEIAVGVVEVKVGIDQIFERQRIDIGEGFEYCGGGIDDAAVDDNFALGAGEDADVAA